MKLEIKGALRHDALNRGRKLILTAEDGDVLDQKLLSGLFGFILASRSNKAALLYLIDELHGSKMDGESARAVYDATSKKLIQTTRGIAWQAKISEARTRYILNVLERGGLVQKAKPSGWCRR